MSSIVAETSRRLPRGWAHLAFQFLIWMGFYVAYQVARGAADRSVTDAFQNGEWVLRQERELGALFEPAVQRVVDTSSLMITLTSFTYWLSQFAVVGITLLWVYFRHHEKFAGFRNWLIVANLVGEGTRLTRPILWLKQAVRHPLSLLRTFWPFRWSRRTVILLIMQSLDNAIRLVPKRRLLRRGIRLSRVGAILARLGPDARSI